LLEEYAGRHPKNFVLLPEGPSTGSARGNFKCLIEAGLGLRDAGPSGDKAYFAFCDQDDIWLPGKLELEMRAMRELEARHGDATPALVFSDLSVVNANGGVRHRSFWKHGQMEPRMVYQLNRLLLQNVVTGCTAIINRPLAELSLRMAPEAFMHDWWIALLCCLFGHAAIVKEPTVLYRQHDGTVIGALESQARPLFPKLREHGARRRLWEQGAHQAEALLRSHGTEMTLPQREVVEAMVRCERSPYAAVRVWTCLRYGFFYRSWRANLAMLWYLWDMERGKRGSAASEER
jgi:hypothetical protein